MNRIKINTENLNIEAYNELIEFEKNQNYTVYYDGAILITHIDDVKELHQYKELKKYQIKKYNNDTINYVNQHLLDCETGIDEIFVNVRGFNDSVEVVDVIGVIEEKGRVYVGLEVEYEDYCYLVNVNFLNVWDFVYKDEMVEIQDVLGGLISEQLKTDLGIQGTVLDDVKEWAEELADEYDNGQIGALNDLMQGGIESGIVSHLIYNGDIMDFYDEHYTEIDEVLKRDNKQMFDTIYAVWYVWEKVAYEYLTHLESK